MRRTLRAVGMMTAILTATAADGRAQVPGEVVVVEPVKPPCPAFASPYGSAPGYGYAPSGYWPHPLPSGIPPHFTAYSDGTVSSPYRPGSVRFWPALGYFASGCGPFLFDFGW